MLGTNELQNQHLQPYWNIGQKFKVAVNGPKSDERDQRETE